MTDVIDAGSPVIVETRGGPIAAVVVSVTADASYGITEAGWEYGVAGPPRWYVVERNGRTWAAPEASVRADPGPGAAESRR